MLDGSQKDFAANVLRSFVYTGSQKEKAKLKAGAQGDLQTTVPVDLLKNKIDVVRTKGGFTLTVRIELSYLGLKEAEGKSKADTAIPLIEKALSEAWTIDLTEGHYAGNEFKLKPKLEFSSNSRRRNERALQFIVRRVARGDSLAEWAHGEISLIRRMIARLERRRKSGRKMSNRSFMLWACRRTPAKKIRGATRTARTSTRQKLSGQKRQRSNSDLSI
jgi:hypothetical protein